MKYICSLITVADIGKLLYTRFKYSPVGDFRPGILKPDLKGCFVWFIAFLIITGIIVGLSVLFEK